MKYLLVLSILSFFCCSTTQSINSLEYQPKKANVVAHGSSSGINQKLVVVCFNKYFNETQFGKHFNSEHNLTQISFRNSMLVEIFLEHSTSKKSIENIRIQENRYHIQVFYDITESDEEPNGFSPYLIIETEKSKKQVQFFENGKLLGAAKQKLYVK